MIYLHAAIVNKIYVTVTLGWHDSNYMYLPASDICHWANVTGLGILCLLVNPATRLQILAGTGWNFFALL